MTVSTDLAPNSIDPNVRLPDSVTAAGSAADALHAQLYAAPVDPDAEAKAAEAAAKAAAEAEEAARAVAAQAAAEGQTTPLPAETHPAPTAADANVSAEEWRHRFLSMQGRFNASQRDKGAMEEQMRQLGQELVRTQNLLASSQGTTHHTPVARTDHNNLITDADRENYGDELIDLARRAGREAVAPELDTLRAENERLQQRVQVTSRKELFAQMDSKLPDWRAINHDTRFKMWLRLPNIYTGKLRGEMLTEAVNGANAPLALQVFRDFLAEVKATGQEAPGQQQTEQQAAPAPRAPAVALETLAAPGRARPASGDSQVPSEKPIYSRANIATFYDEKRRGLWAHRKAEADAIEADFIAAQTQGRIR